jgi:hypothetical protein
MSDQYKDGNGPISSGTQPGPQERLRDDALRTESTSDATSSNMGAASSAAGSSGAGSSSGSTSPDQKFTEESMRESAARIAGDAKQYAGDMANRAKEMGRSMFEEQKESAVDKVDGIARAVRNTASGLQGEGQDQVARYINMVADQLGSLSGRLREKDLNALVNDAQDLARRAPATFFVGSMVTGFLLARFLKSSSEQRQDYLATSDWNRPTTSTRESFPRAETAGTPSSVEEDTPDAALSATRVGAGPTGLNRPNGGGNPP